MNTKQQPLALMLADRLHHEQPMVLRIDAEHAGEELLRQHARITELESQLAQRFDAADMATAAAQGFRDGVASVAHQPITDTNTASGAADKVLAYLDDLSDDAAAHIFPSDLAKCMTSECVVEVVSVRAGNPNERTVPLFSREQVVAALASTQAQPVAEPADTVVLNAAMRAIQQAIELIGAPTDERMRAVRRVLRGAVIVAEDAGKVAPLPGMAYAALPEPLEIDWPELHSQALGCGVEDRDLHNRYECAEYGWQDGADKCAERVPEQIFDADQMHAFADATCALRPSNGQAPAQPDPAYSEACNLATALFKKHFAHLPDYASGQVVWGLFDSTEGVILQIDNMVSGLVQPPTTSPQADSVQEDAARYRWLRDQAHPDSEDSGIAVSESDFNDWGNKFTRYYSGEELDAAIDAARKQGASHD